MFPAGAGMNRMLRAATCGDEDVPRWRGDEPQLGKIEALLTTCSPLARG